MRPLPLVIRTTGVEDYIDGSANIKMLVIGGPDTGKTRMSSFWPNPIYADCEAGRASLADRKVKYAPIRNSQDMLDFLAHVKGFEHLPKDQRPFQTVVIDTIDSFQRKVKDEWIQANRKPMFTGRDAWGYLESRMSMLMTRLLNLDYNVLVLCHFKDKTIKDGEDERRELTLQLQGDIKDNAFNDFDLVGWLGTYWAAENGERVEKRGLSFKKTPERPFLKDRCGVMPAWIPIDFTPDDYGRVLEAFLSRVDSLDEGQVVGEIGPAVDPGTVPTAGVVGPVGGALPPVEPAEIPLAGHDKPTLAKMARDLGITALPDGRPIRGNTIKSELLEALEHHKLQQQQNTDSAPESAESPTPPASGQSEPAAETPPVAKPEPTPPAVEAPAEQPTPVTSADAADVKPDEKVDPVSGEVTHDQAVQNVQQILGAQVVSDEPVAEAPAAPAPTSAPKSGAVCAECGKDLSNEKPDIVRLSKIRFRKPLCAADYTAAKNAA